MASYNLIVLMGNLTKDIQLSYTPNQVEMANFGIAVNKKYKTANGEQKESVLFIDCVAFKKNAINLNKYVFKGSPILITGELQLDMWEKDGQKYSKHKVMVHSFQLLPTGQPKEQEPQQQARAEPAKQTDGEDDTPW